MKTYEQLVQAVKLWVLENNKSFLNFNLDEISDRYVEGLLPSDDMLDIQDKYVSDSEKILVSFKGSVTIDYRSAVHRNENKFVYFKLCEAVFDDDGNVIEYSLIGYDW